MALFLPKPDLHRRASTSLEPELHEGDGRIPAWLWLVVAAVILFAGVFAPFQLY